MIVIIDYGVGNLGSIVSMLSKMHIPSKVSRSPEDIQQASRLILPGVGAFDKAMRELKKLCLIDLLHTVVLKDKKPILGICLGAQILGLSSEEGELQGLGWIDMTTKRFSSPTLRIPHMGWRHIQEKKTNSFFSSSEEQRFYFSHSYCMCPNFKEDVLATAFYGSPFAAAVQRENILGVQFHPEKSHQFGSLFLQRFAHAS